MATFSYVFLVTVFALSLTPVWCGDYISSLGGTTVSGDIISRCAVAIDAGRATDGRGCGSSDTLSGVTDVGSGEGVRIQAERGRRLVMGARSGSAEPLPEETPAGPTPHRAFFSLPKGSPLLAGSNAVDLVCGKDATLEMMRAPFPGSGRDATGETRGKAAESVTVSSPAGVAVGSGRIGLEGNQGEPPVPIRVDSSGAVLIGDGGGAGLHVCHGACSANATAGSGQTLRVHGLRTGKPSTTTAPTPTVVSLGAPGVDFTGDLYLNGVRLPPAGGSGATARRSGYRFGRVQAPMQDSVFSCGAGTGWLTLTLNRDMTADIYGGGPADPGAVMARVDLTSGTVKLRRGWRFRVRADTQLASSSAGPFAVRIVPVLNTSGLGTVAGSSTPRGEALAMGLIDVPEAAVSPDDTDAEFGTYAFQLYCAGGVVDVDVLGQSADTGDDEIYVLFEAWPVSKVPASAQQSSPASPTSSSSSPAGTYIRADAVFPAAPPLLPLLAWSTVPLNRLPTVTSEGTGTLDSTSHVLNLTPYPSSYYQTPSSTGAPAAEGMWYVSGHVMVFRTGASRVRLVDAATGETLVAGMMCGTSGTVAVLPCRIEGVFPMASAVSRTVRVEVYNSDASGKLGAAPLTESPGFLAAVIEFEYLPRVTHGMPEDAPERIHRSAPYDFEVLPPRHMYSPRAALVHTTAYGTDAGIWSPGLNSWVPLTFISLDPKDAKAPFIISEDLATTGTIKLKAGIYRAELGLVFTDNTAFVQYQVRLRSVESGAVLSYGTHGVAYFTTSGSFLADRFTVTEDGATVAIEAYTTTTADQASEQGGPKVQSTVLHHELHQRMHIWQISTSPTELVPPHTDPTTGYAEYYDSNGVDTRNATTSYPLPGAHVGAGPTFAVVGFSVTGGDRRIATDITGEAHTTNPPSGLSNGVHVRPLHFPQGQGSDADPPGPIVVTSPDVPGDGSVFRDARAPHHILLPPGRYRVHASHMIGDVGSAAHAGISLTSLGGGQCLSHGIDIPVADYALGYIPSCDLDVPPGKFLSIAPLAFARIASFGSATASPGEPTIERDGYDSFDTLAIARVGDPHRRGGVCWGGDGSCCWQSDAVASAAGAPTAFTLGFAAVFRESTAGDTGTPHLAGAWTRRVFSFPHSEHAGLRFARANATVMDGDVGGGSGGGATATAPEPSATCGEASSSATPIRNAAATVTPQGGAWLIAGCYEVRVAAQMSDCKRTRGRIVDASGAVLSTSPSFANTQTSTTYMGTVEWSGRINVTSDTAVYLETWAEKDCTGGGSALGGLPLRRERTFAVLDVESCAAKENLYATETEVRVETDTAAVTGSATVAYTAKLPFSRVARATGITQGDVAVPSTGTVRVDRPGTYRIRASLYLGTSAGYTPRCALHVAAPSNRVLATSDSPGGYYITRMYISVEAHFDVPTDLHFVCAGEIASPRFVAPITAAHRPGHGKAWTSWATFQRMRTEQESLEHAKRLQTLRTSPLFNPEPSASTMPATALVGSELDLHGDGLGVARRLTTSSYAAYAFTSPSGTTSGDVAALVWDVSPLNTELPESSQGSITSSPVTGVDADTPGRFSYLDAASNTVAIVAPGVYEVEARVTSTWSCTHLASRVVDATGRGVLLGGSTEACATGWRYGPVSTVRGIIHVTRDGGGNWRIGTGSGSGTGSGGNALPAEYRNATVRLALESIAESLPSTAGERRGFASSVPSVDEHYSTLRLWRLAMPAVYAGDAAAAAAGASVDPDGDGDGQQPCSARTGDDSDNAAPKVGDALRDEMRRWTVPKLARGAYALFRVRRSVGDVGASIAAGAWAPLGTLSPDHTAIYAIPSAGTNSTSSGGVDGNDGSPIPGLVGGGGTRIRGASGVSHTPGFNSNGTGLRLTPAGEVHVPPGAYTVTLLSRPTNTEGVRVRLRCVDGAASSNPGGASASDDANPSLLACDGPGGDTEPALGPSRYANYARRQTIGYALEEEIAVVSNGGSALLPEIAVTRVAGTGNHGTGYPADAGGRHTIGGREDLAVVEFVSHDVPVADHAVMRGNVRAITTTLATPNAYKWHDLTVDDAEGSVGGFITVSGTGSFALEMPGIYRVRVTYPHAYSSDAKLRIVEETSGLPVLVSTTCGAESPASYWQSSTCELLGPIVLGGPGAAYDATIPTPRGERPIRRYRVEYYVGANTHSSAGSGFALPVGVREDAPDNYGFMTEVWRLASCSDARAETDRAAAGLSSHLVASGLTAVTLTERGAAGQPNPYNPSLVNEWHPRRLRHARTTGATELLSNASLAHELESLPFGESEFIVNSGGGGGGYPVQDGYGPPVGSGRFDPRRLSVAHAHAGAVTWSGGNATSGDSPYDGGEILIGEPGVYRVQARMPVVYPNAVRSRLVSLTDSFGAAVAYGPAQQVWTDVHTDLFLTALVTVRTRHARLRLETLAVQNHADGLGKGSVGARAGAAEVFTTARVSKVRPLSHAERLTASVFETHGSCTLRWHGTLAEGTSVGDAGSAGVWIERPWFPHGRCDTAWTVYPTASFESVYGPAVAVHAATAPYPEGGPQSDAAGPLVYPMTESQTRDVIEAVSRTSVLTSSLLSGSSSSPFPGLLGGSVVRTIALRPGQHRVTARVQARNMGKTRLALFNATAIRLGTPAADALLCTSLACESSSAAHPCDLSLACYVSTAPDGTSSGPSAMSSAFEYGPQHMSGGNATFESRSSPGATVTDLYDEATGAVSPGSDLPAGRDTSAAEVSLMVFGDTLGGGGTGAFGHLSAGIDRRTLSLFAELDIERAGPWVRRPGQQWALLRSERDASVSTTLAATGSHAVTMHRMSGVGARSFVRLDAGAGPSGFAVRPGAYRVRLRHCGTGSASGMVARIAGHAVGSLAWSTDNTVTRCSEFVGDIAVSHPHVNANADAGVGGTVHYDDTSKGTVGVNAARKARGEGTGGFTDFYVPAKDDGSAGAARGQRPTSTPFVPLDVRVDMGSASAVYALGHNVVRGFTIERGTELELVRLGPSDDDRDGDEDLSQGEAAIEAARSSSSSSPAPVFNALVTPDEASEAWDLANGTAGAPDQPRPRGVIAPREYAQIVYAQPAGAATALPSSTLANSRQVRFLNDVRHNDAGLVVNLTRTVGDPEDHWFELLPGTYRFEARAATHRGGVQYIELVDSRWPERPVARSPAVQCTNVAGHACELRIVADIDVWPMAPCVNTSSSSASARGARMHIVHFHTLAQAADPLAPPAASAASGAEELLTVVDLWRLAPIGEESGAPAERDIARFGPAGILLASTSAAGVMDPSLDATTGAWKPITFSRVEWFGASTDQATAGDNWGGTSEPFCRGDIGESGGSAVTQIELAPGDWFIRAPVHTYGNYAKRRVRLYSVTRGVPLGYGMSIGLSYHSSVGVLVANITVDGPSSETVEIQMQRDTAVTTLGELSDFEDETHQQIMLEHVSAPTMLREQRAVIVGGAASGVDADVLPAGEFVPRRLDRMAHDAGGVINSLDTSTGVFTLGPGSYDIHVDAAMAWCRTLGCAAVLVNADDLSDIATSPQMTTRSAYETTHNLRIRARVTVNQGDTLSLRVDSYTMETIVRPGVATGFDAEDEIYTIVTVRRTTLPAVVATETHPVGSNLAAAAAPSHVWRTRAPTGYEYHHAGPGDIEKVYKGRIEAGTGSFWIPAGAYIVEYVSPIYSTVNTATRLIDAERNVVIHRGPSWRQGFPERGSQLEGIGYLFVRKPTLVSYEVYASGTPDYVRSPLGFGSGQGFHMTFRRWASKPDGEPLLGAW